MGEGEKVSLGKVCDVRDGTHNSPKYVKNGYPLITSKNITNGRMDFDNVSLISQDDYNQINKRSFVDDGDILMPMIGTIGNPVIVNKKREFAIKNVALIKFKNAEISNKYVNYCLKSNLFINYIDKENRGGTQKFLSLDNIRKFCIPLPSFDVQKYITDTLDKTQEIIDGHKKQLEELDNLIKTTFYEMFGDPFKNEKWWEKYIFTECIIFNPSKSEVREYNSSTAVTFIPMANIGVNAEINTSEIRILSDVYKGFTYFKERDVLLAKITPCFENGKAAIARNLKNNLGFGSTEFHVMRPIKNLSVSEWILYFLKTDTFLHDATRAMSGSAGQKRIQKDFFEKLKIGLPPVNLQNKFAEIVTNIEAQKALVKQSIAESQNLFNSLMSEYFD
jgi:type I restriction enzyme S subunit